MVLDRRAGDCADLMRLCLVKAGLADDLVQLVGRQRTISQCSKSNIQRGSVNTWREWSFTSARSTLPMASSPSAISTWMPGLA